MKRLLICMTSALVVALACTDRTRADAPPAKGVVTNSVGMRLVPIPAGRFVMGATDPAAEEDERPAHVVVLSRPFLMGAHEVTQEQYRRVMGENPSWFSPIGPGRADVAGEETGRHPVDRVTWDEAATFCRRLSERPAERQAGRTYRLPTEAEWEYACRAGTTTAFSTGDDLPADAACFGRSAADGDIEADFCTGPRGAGFQPARGAAGQVKNLPHGHNGLRPQSKVTVPSDGHTMPVGSYRPNAFGLYDMHGNVWEWCADPYRFDAYTNATPRNPQGPPDGTGRVVRGGAWNFPAAYCRSSNRDLTRQTRRDVGNGFRVVCVRGE